MKISPISVLKTNYQPKFKGQKFYFTSDMYNACWNLTPDPSRAKSGGTAKIAVEGHPNPNITLVEIKEGRNFLDPESVYWADPLETLSEERMKEFKFVVFEHEPEYPALENFSEAYFGGYAASERINEMSKIGDVQGYFYRLEMADQKELKRLYRNEHKEYNFHQLKEKIDFYQSRINFAKFKQWEAATCSRMISDAYKLWDRKYMLSREITFLTGNLERNVYDNKIAEYEGYIQKIQTRMIPVKEKLRACREKLSSYRVLEKYGSENSVCSNSKEEKTFIEAQIEGCNRMLKHLLQKIKEDQNYIKKFKAEIQYYKDKKLEAPALIKEYSAELEKVKAELIPHFENLKNFYIKQGLRLK